MSSLLTALIFLGPIVLFLALFISSELASTLFVGLLIVGVFAAIVFIGSMGTGLLFEELFPSKQTQREREMDRNRKQLAVADIRKVEEELVDGKIICTNSWKFIFDFDSNKFVLFDRDYCIKHIYQLNSFFQARIYINGNVVEKFSIIEETSIEPKNPTTGILLYYSTGSEALVFLKCKKMELEQTKEAINILLEKSMYNT